MGSFSDSLAMGLTDSSENRMIHYILCSVIEFQSKAREAINVSDDKKHTKPSGLSSGIGLVTGGTLAATGGGMAANVTKGLVVGAIRTKEQCIEHKKAKKLEKFFEGFDHEDEFEKWRDFLVDIFADIFINYNIQFIHLLQDLTDSWSKAMKKLAKDSVYRVFDQLSKEDPQSLTKELVLKCFVHGDSQRKYSNVVFGKTDVGGQIKIKEADFRTADLFTKPALTHELRKQKKNNPYFYRYPFLHEQPDRQPQQTFTQSSFDKYELLLQRKDCVVQQVKIKMQKPLHQIQEILETEGKQLREDIAQVVDEMSKKIEDDRTSKAFSKEQAKNLIYSQLGMDALLEHIDFDITNVSHKAITHHDMDSKLVSGFNDYAKAATAAVDSSTDDKLVSEVQVSYSIFEQIYSFSIKKKILLKNDRDDELLKKCIKIGRTKELPIKQEELIDELRFEYQPQIEIGSFGVGMVMEASTRCISDKKQPKSKLIKVATKINAKFFHEQLNAYLDGNHDLSLSNDEAENLTDKYAFKSKFTRRGDTGLDDARQLALFPELQGQTNEKSGASQNHQSVS